MYYRIGSLEAPHLLTQKIEPVYYRIGSLEDEDDFIIINDRLDEAIEAFVAVANVARLKQSEDTKKKFVTQWLGK